MIEIYTKTSKLYFLAWVLIAVNIVLAIPKPEEVSHKNAQDLFNSHIGSSNHNTEYDHEAFLGEETKTFEELSPEESKRRLMMLIDKIDEDKNELVDLSELKKWISYTQRRYIEDDVTRNWKQHNLESKNFISWNEYKNNVYGFLDEMDPAELEKDSNGFSYKAMLIRDRRRWSVADINNNDELTFDEYMSFLHPENIPSMNDVVLSETIEDIDKNNDGKISIDEYIGDMFKGKDVDEGEPDWVITERKNFEQYRDRDHDGFLDRDEVMEWISPKDFDHAEAEAKHLIFEADQDNNGQLSKQEILENYDVFVGSQATDFGEAFTKHDEF